MANVLIVVAQKGFQPVECGDTRAEIEEEGHEVEVGSITTENAVAADGNEAVVDTAVKEAIVDNYSAVVLIGGPGAPELGNHEEVLELVKEAAEKGKVIAAICIAPTILAKAGVLEGKKATVWTSETDKEPANTLKEAGAEYTGESVTVDGKLITGDGPSAANEFGKKIVEALR